VISRRTRRTTCGVIGVLLPVIALIQPASGQTSEQPSPGTSRSSAAAERLSLDTAISLAVAHNRDGLRRDRILVGRDRFQFHSRKASLNDSLRK
jgi:hypothetical protein